MAGRSIPRSALADSLLLVAIAVVLPLIRIGRPPGMDEFLHVLAAHSLLADGTLQITPYAAPYTRGALFTYLTAGSFRLFGEGLLSARALPLAAGVALVLSLYGWVRREAGRGPALAAGLLLATCPLTVELQQFARFYTLHALLYLWGAILVYAATRPGPAPRERGLLAAGALVALLVALHLQRLTVIGLAALAVWAIAALSPGLRRRWERAGRPTAWVVVPAAAVVLAVAGLFVGGVPQRYWALFSHVDLWAAGHSDDPLFYHHVFLQWYPTIWALLPLVLAAAAVGAPRLTAFCALLFGLPLLVQSFAAWKATRYAFYILPFLFAFAGVAIASAIPHATRLYRAALDRVTAARAGIRISAVATSLTVLTVLGAAKMNGAFGATLGLLSIDNRPDWTPAVPYLRSIADSTDAIVAGSALRAFYYFGRANAETRADHLGRRQFSMEPNTGLPVVTSVEAFDTLRGCFDTGLFLAERREFGTTVAVPPALARHIAASLRRVRLPAGRGIVAYRWAERGTPVPAEACARLLPGYPATGRSSVR